MSEVDSGRSFTGSEGERLRPQVQAGYARQAAGSVGPGGHGSWWKSQRGSGSTAGNYVRDDGSDPEPDLLHRPLGGLVRPGEFEPGGLPTTWPPGTANCPLVWPARASDREMVRKHWPDKDSWPMLKDKEKCVRGFVANFEARYTGRPRTAPLTRRYGGCTRAWATKGRTSTRACLGWLMSANR